MDKGTRASMNGQVPASMTYPEWFEKQSASVQREVLGKTRYKWYKEGKFKLTDFVDNGETLTIEQLMKKM